MGKRHEFICIAHWQTETVRHKDREFTFSPFGLGQIDGWVLMDWRRVKICDMGHRHTVEHWHNFPSLEPQKKEPPVPHVPREVWRELAKKTETTEKQSWPGQN